MTAFDEIKATASGLATLKDWLGDGQPVERRVAQARAFVCEYCPKNIEANWWGRIKNSISGAIRDQLEIKSKMDMELVNEPRLAMCGVCKCCVRLKVWCPIGHIAIHTPQQMREQFPEPCWIRRELNS